jgi:hypothetical protein
MRNVWKGLVLGAFTGAATGLVLDLLEGGARQVSSSLESASLNVPVVTDRVREGVSELSDKLQESELPHRVKDAATKAGHRAVSSASGAVSSASGSDSAAAIRHQASEVASATKDAAQHGRQQATRVARASKDAADQGGHQAARLAAAGKEKIGSVTAD